MPRGRTSGGGQGMALRQRRKLVGAARGCTTCVHLTHPGQRGDGSVAEQRRRSVPNDVEPLTTLPRPLRTHEGSALPMLLRVLPPVVVTALVPSSHWFRRATRCTCVAEPVELQALALVSSRIRESHGER